jgi:hypothetical protein
MAKRARGSTSRPGQRAPLRATAPARPAAPSTRPTTLTAEEEARAAELEAQIVAAEKAAETAQRRARSRRDSGESTSVMNGTIAMRAAEEYRYVARDMRRIVIIAGGLTLFLIGLWLVTVVTGIQLG